MIRSPKVNSDVITIVSGLALIAAGSTGCGFGPFSSGTPTIISPLPALTLLAGFFVGKAVIILPTLLFFAWNPGLFRGQAKIPKRSHVLFWALAALSVIYFVASWTWGVQYEGVRYTETVCAVNVVWVGLLGFTFVRSWKREPSFGWNLFVHWMLFAWLAWYAFPTLGELP